MKFNILQSDLWPVLSSVSRSCGARAQLPVLGNILLQAQGGKMKLSATNLEIGVVKCLKAEIEEEGEVTVPAKILVEVVSNLAGQKLEISSLNDQLTISSPNFSAVINGISASEFPSIPLSGKEAIGLKPDILTDSLPKIAFASAAEEARPVLTGILTEIKDGKIQLVATDGYRLSYKESPIEEKINFKTLIPKRGLEEVARLLTEEETEVVKISLSDDQNQIIFKFGDTQLSSRLIEGQFPAWEKVIPQSFKARIAVDRGELLKAVKLASIFSRNEANMVRVKNLPTKLVITSESREFGNQKTEVEAQSEGEDLDIVFNSKFLQDVLSAIPSSQVTMELSGNLSAALIRPVGDDSLKYIIMPVNLS